MDILELSTLSLNEFLQYADLPEKFKIEIIELQKTVDQLEKDVSNLEEEIADKDWEIEDLIEERECLRDTLTEIKQLINTKL